MTVICIFSAQPHNFVKPLGYFYPLGCHVTTREALNVDVNLEVLLCTLLPDYLRKYDQ